MKTIRLGVSAVALLSAVVLLTAARPATPPCANGPGYATDWRLIELCTKAKCLSAPGKFISEWQFCLTWCCPEDWGEKLHFQQCSPVQEADCCTKPGEMLRAAGGFVCPAPPSGGGG